ncbi:hypothetical protein LEP1GSC050_0681 [Leptospira broomii serovar Hurstbridge str. 5399]|uniref:Uncharacterized protein n=1 Tax=Leptospira broomii serovar Hurstbridge str. 5399 TaxID=1049789 RepID=T0F6U7_9LEPT|nr:hypothetical protein LEP1GSC050_0681 [Leptospira broomii serovar Hurstbridge str. 5399]
MLRIDDSQFFLQNRQNLSAVIMNSVAFKSKLLAYLLE